MKHLRDLTVTEAQAFVDTPKILIGEKLDGSYFECGRDEFGFYTKQKGPKKFRDCTEYTEYYQNAFRAAHTVAEYWYDLWKDKIPADHPVQFEVYGSCMPNVVRYLAGRCLIVISDLTPFNVSQEELEYVIPSVQYQLSSDGKQIDNYAADQTWTLKFNSMKLYTPYSTGPNIIRDGIKNDKGLADLPLNKKLPDGVTKEDVLHARAGFKAYMSFAAELLLNEVNQRRILFLNNASEVLPYEGVVFRYGERFDQCVKIIHPQFKIHNAFYHIWQDKLIGPDYSFKKMFAENPLKLLEEKTIELDRLLAKYLKNPYNEDEVHARTLLLFAEERRRLNGR